MAIVICSDLKRADIGIERRNLRNGDEWAVIWDEDAPTTAEAESPYRVGISASDLNADDELRITVIEPGPEGGSVRVRDTFYLGSKVLSDLWLRSDGSSEPTPCPG